MLGVRVSVSGWEPVEGETDGWNPAERKALQERIAARQPFLDFSFSRVNVDGSRQAFRVSGQPMFNQSARFIGYRGIGVEVAPAPLQPAVPAPG